MKIKLALDLDGVLFDFVKAICEHFERPNPYDNGFTGYWIEESQDFKGISRNRVFAVCKDNPGFWETLDKTPEADHIVATVFGLFSPENVCACTSPTIPPEPAIKGKRLSLRRHYKDTGLEARMIPTAYKYFLASPGTILVDDSDDNVQAFEAHGGLTILVPRPWNKRRGETFNFEAELNEKIQQAIKNGYEM